MQKKLEIKKLPELELTLGLSIYKLKNIISRIESLYRQREEDKKGGSGTRIISAPNRELKTVQKKIHEKLFSELDFGDFSHYGIKKRSNISNALKHKGNNVVLQIDLKSFFPSIRPERVCAALIHEQGCSSLVAELLTKLTTYRFQLPQGAPTSTCIANIVTARLQRRISGLAQQWGIKGFTIYCDDITFSSNSIPAEFVERVKNIIKAEKFRVHPEKGGIFDKSKAQIITGINISHGLALGKMKKIWRAERHNSLLQFQAGKLSKKEFGASEEKYFARKHYERSVVKSNKS